MLKILAILSKLPIKKIIFWALVFLLIGMLLACSPIKRLERFQKNNPSLFDHKNDTITVKDTIRIVVPGANVDTVVSLSRLKDTLYVNKNQLHVKVIRIKGDSVYISGKCDTVIKTVIREVKVPFSKYNVYQVKRSIFSNWKTKLIILILLIFAGAVVYEKYFKKS